MSKEGRQIVQTCEPGSQSLDRTPEPSSTSQIRILGTTDKAHMCLLARSETRCDGLTVGVRKKIWRTKVQFCLMLYALALQRESNPDHIALSQ